MQKPTLTKNLPLKKIQNRPPLRTGGHHTISVRKGGAEVVKEDPKDALKNDEVAVIKKEGEKGSEKEAKEDETEAQEENEGVELQVLKRKTEQRRGNGETSPEDSLQTPEDISQSERNKEEEETADAETDGQKEGGDW